MYLKTSSSISPEIYLWSLTTAILWTKLSIIFLFFKEMPKYKISPGIIPIIGFMKTVSRQKQNQTKFPKRKLIGWKKNPKQNSVITSRKNSEIWKGKFINWNRNGILYKTNSPQKTGTALKLTSSQSS